MTSGPRGGGGAIIRGGASIVEALTSKAILNANSNNNAKGNGEKSNVLPVEPHMKGKGKKRWHFANEISNKMVFYQMALNKANLERSSTATPAPKNKWTSSTSQTSRHQIRQTLETGSSTALIGSWIQLVFQNNDGEEAIFKIAAFLRDNTMTSKAPPAPVHLEMLLRGILKNDVSSEGLNSAWIVLQPFLDYHFDTPADGPASAGPFPLTEDMVVILLATALDFQAFNHVHRLFSYLRKSNDPLTSRIFIRLLKCHEKNSELVGFKYTFKTFFRPEFFKDLEFLKYIYKFAISSNGYVDVIRDMEDICNQISTAALGDTSSFPIARNVENGSLSVTVASADFSNKVVSEISSPRLPIEIQMYKIAYLIRAGKDIPLELRQAHGVRKQRIQLHILTCLLNNMPLGKERLLNFIVPFLTRLLHNENFHPSVDFFIVALQRLGRAKNDEMVLFIENALKNHLNFSRKDFYGCDHISAVLAAKIRCSLVTEISQMALRVSFDDRKDALSSYSQLINAALEKNNLSLALSLYSKLITLKVKKFGVPDSLIGCLFINFCNNQKLVRQGLEIYEKHLLVDGLVPDTNVYKALMKLTSDNPVESDKYWHQYIIRQSGVALAYEISTENFNHLDIDIIGCRIEQLLKTRRFQEGYSLFQSIERHPQLTYITLALLFKNAGEVDNVFRIFSLMESKGYKHTLTSVGILVNALRSSKRITHLEHFIIRIHREKLPLNPYILNSIVNAFLESKLFLKGMKLMMEMKALDLSIKTLRRNARNRYRQPFRRRNATLDILETRVMATSKIQQWFEWLTNGKGKFAIMVKDGKFTGRERNVDYSYYLDKASSRNPLDSIFYLGLN